MIDERERDWVADEIEEVEAARDRIIEARAANPHLDHWKSDIQLARIEDQLDRLREQAA